jgi:hypothetical protein
MLQEIIGTQRISEKCHKLLRSPQPPFLRGEKFLKVPLFKGMQGGSSPSMRLDYDFSDILSEQVAVKGSR